MSTPFAKVLVPIDFSEHSLGALRLADTLVQETKGVLHLVHVLETNPWAFYASLGVLGASAVLPATNDLPPDLNNIKAAIEKALGKLASEKRGGPCTYEVRTGNAVEQILAAAKERGASVIVISTHGRTGLAHLAIGSVAERVMRHSPVPVLSTRASVAVA